MKRETVALGCGQVLAALFVATLAGFEAQVLGAPMWAAFALGAHLLLLITFAISIRSAIESIGDAQ